MDDEISDLHSKVKRTEARLKIVREEGEEAKTVLEQEVKTLQGETTQLKEENEQLVIKSQAVKKVAFVDSSASPTPPASPAAALVEPPAGPVTSNAEVGVSYILPVIAIYTMGGMHKL